MAILSSFPVTRWCVTLNRAESSTESPLTPADITITGNAVSSITGSGLNRVLILGTAVASLPPSSITFLAHTGMTVVSTTNLELQEFLSEIRNILDIGVDAETLPNSVIESLPFLRAAELEVLKLTENTDSSYDTKAAADPLFRERMRISVMYRTAARLLFSFPTIVAESELQLSSRYQQIDPDEKINFWLSFSDDTIKEDVVSPTSEFSGGVVIAGHVAQYVAF